MATIPAKLLRVIMTNNGPTGTPEGTIYDEGSPWYGYPKRWNVRLLVDYQATSYQQPATGEFGYSSADIKVGDWLASSPGGVAVKIVEITATESFTSIDLVVEDEDNYNTYSDFMIQGNGIGPEGPGFVFEVDPTSGLPVLGPMPSSFMDPVTQGDLMGRFLKLGKLKVSSGGGSEFLTEPSTGSYDDGFIKNWLPGTTRLSDAVRAINVAIGQIKPAEAPTLSSQLFDIEGGLYMVNGNPIILASGATDNTTIPEQDRPPQGIAVKRVLRRTVNTTEAGPFGPGNRGQLMLMQNGVIKGAADLSPGSNAGSYDKLEITTDTAYPANQPGFNDALTARGVALEAADGLNYVELRHSDGTSSQRCFFVLDNNRTLPTIVSSNVSLVEGAKITYSSGIPHIDRDSVILVSGQVKDLATDITLDRQNVEISTVPVNVGPTTWVSAGDNGLPKVATKAALHNFENVRYVVSDTQNNPAYGSVQIQITARNPNGAVDMVVDQFFNVMRGGNPTGVGPIDETNIPVLELGESVDGRPLAGFRVMIPAEVGETRLAPEVYYDLFPDVWDSLADPADYEASVVGGNLICDTTDYTKYVPPGPNYSGKLTTQYATFAVCRTGVSRMIIQVRGKYSRMLVKLPGVGNTPMSPNGWWDTGVLYEGSGTPGRDGSSSGCAVGEPALGFDQDVLVTFGPESSAYSDNNLILVRFALTGDDRVTGLRFKGVE